MSDSSQDQQAKKIKERPNTEGDLDIYAFSDLDADMMIDPNSAEQFAHDLDDPDPKLVKIRKEVMKRARETYAKYSQEEDK